MLEAAGVFSTAAAAAGGGGHAKVEDMNWLWDEL